MRVTSANIKPFFCFKLCLFVSSQLVFRLVASVSLLQSRLVVVLNALLVPASAVESPKRNYIRWKVLHDYIHTSSGTLHAIRQHDT